MLEADESKLPALANLNGSLADRVYQALKDAILKLEFPPGAIIRKLAVCEQFGVSRSPVSDALTKLATEGLVEVVPQSGTRVAPLSMAAVREDAFLREALEVAAARHAAEHRSDETLARLARNIEMQKLLIADVDAEDFVKADTTFHEVIMETTGVRRLVPTTRALSPHVDRARRLLVPEPGRLTDTLAEHIKILDAIRDRDAAAAQDAMQAHLRQLLQRLEPLESVRPDLFTN